MNESETWKDVIGYEGYYKVSNKGNVYSVVREDVMGRKWGGLILKPVCDRGGYLKVVLYKNSKMKNKSIHRLVAEAFIPNHNDYLEINHKDENKTNNHVENLEWCTSKYNMNYGTRNEKAARKNYKKVRAINVETGEVLTFNSAKGAHSKGYPSASQACRGVFKSGKGKLIGDGHLYKGHRWSYE